MTILTRLPDLHYPNPIGNCIDFCLYDDRFLQSGSEFAFALICFSQEDINVGGENITMLGSTFSTTDNEAFSHITWKAGPTRVANALNFIQMLRSNYIFDDYRTDVYVDANTGEYCITILSKTPGLIENFEFDLSGLTNAPEVTVNKGTDAIFTQGFKVSYTLYDCTTNLPLFPLKAIELTRIEKDDSSIPSCVQVQNSIKGLVKTTLPKLDSGFYYDETITRDFYLRYGSLQDKFINTFFGLSQSCGVTHNQYYETDKFKIINSSVQIEESNFEDYYYNPIRDNKVKFLTLAPRPERLCSDSYYWLWLYVNYNQFAEGIGTVTYKLRVKYCDFGLVIRQTETELGTKDGVLVIPVGLANMLYPVEAYFQYYIVQVIAELDINGTKTVKELSEEYSFYLTPGCCDDVQLMFLSSKGGYSKIGSHHKLGHDILTEASEICLDIPCEGEKLITGGKTQVNGKAYEKITVETNYFQKTGEQLRHYVDFKSSTDKYIIVNFQGKILLRKFLIEPGSVKIWERNNKIKITATGYYHNEFKVL